MGGPASLKGLHCSRTLLRPTSGQVGHGQGLPAAIPASLSLRTPVHVLQLQQSAPSPHGRAAARTGSTRSISHLRSRCKAAASVGSSVGAQVRAVVKWPRHRLSMLCAQTPIGLGCHPLTEDCGLQAAAPSSEADCALAIHRAYTGLTQANLPTGREAGLAELGRLARGGCQQPGHNLGGPGCHLQSSHAGPGPGGATSAGEPALSGRLPEAGAAEQAVPSRQTGSCHQSPAHQPLHQDAFSAASLQADTSLSQSGQQQPGADLAGLSQSGKQHRHQQPHPAMDLADAGAAPQPEAWASQQGAWVGAGSRRRQQQQQFMMAVAPAPPMPRDPGRSHRGWGMFTLGVFLAMMLQFFFSWLSVSPFWENIFR